MISLSTKKRLSAYPGARESSPCTLAEEQGRSYHDGRCLVETPRPDDEGHAQRPTGLQPLNLQLSHLTLRTLIYARLFSYQIFPIMTKDLIKYNVLCQKRFSNNRILCQFVCVCVRNISFRQLLRYIDTLKSSH